MVVGFLAGLVGIGEGVEHDAPRLLGRHLVGSVLFEDDGSPGPWLPFAPHEPPRVGPPTPVQPVAHALERADLLVGNLALHDVGEDVAASSHHIAEKLPTPCSLVGLAKVLRLLDERLAQPLWVRRDHIEVRGLPDERVLALPPRQGLLVHPAHRRLGRIEGVEDPEPASAAPKRVENGPHVLDAAMLVQLLEPYAGAIPLGELGRLQLQRIVAAAEDDALPGREVHDLQRRYLGLEVLAQPQRVDGPEHLRVHRIPQRVAEPPHHDHVHLGVCHGEKNEAKGNERALRRATSPVKPVVRMAVHHHVAEHGVEAFDAEVSRASRRHRMTSQP